MLSILDFTKKKRKGEKITMITCYDYTSAVLTGKTGVDCILVGDSLAMTMHGFETTVSATTEMMALHIAAVARGATDKFIIGDMPFLSYRKALSDNMDAVQQIMQAGAHAVKLEGTAGNVGFIRHLVDSGVPVMGHIGLTPQFVHQLGGYRVQGRDDKAAKQLLQDAKALEEAGCFALVMECVPAPLAKKITESVGIATIGIGAGADTDGQVLVFQDLLGLNTEFRPKFVKQYLGGADLVTGAIDSYVEEVKTGVFPDAAYSFDAAKLAQPA